MNKNVTVIPQKEKNSKQKIRTAVYARVSTKAERQGDSLKNQIEHYTETIGRDPNYELVEIYYDFGISGFKEARPGFQRMMDDAEAGRFQLIITKAITRFARNTRTVLESTRRLKELGIDIFFELQGIHTMSQEGELLMTLFAAFGQAESEGARLHTLMALKRKYEAGNPPHQLQRAMGYSKTEDGEFYPDEFAPLVLEMYEMAADGYTSTQIARYLNSEGVKNHNGCRFNRGSVYRLLRSPIYKGDFIAQQYFVNEDRKLLKNNGEKPKYYIEEDHPPIVSQELWQKAQQTLDAAKHSVDPTRSRPQELNDENYPYRKQLFCAACGHRLKRAMRADRILWECSGKERFSKDFCRGVLVTDDEIRSWLPLEGGNIYVYENIEKQKVIGHGYMPESEWKQTHRKKKPDKKAPPLREENYPYMKHIFCKYCGSPLRRIINDNGTVTWVCNRMSRQGKEFCKGIRVPDQVLKPLAEKEGNFYIGKEFVNGKESYGYSRKPDSSRE